jgi:23S rRNA-/tRNA-specific pseudouridylate synthase
MKTLRSFTFGNFRYSLLQLHPLTGRTHQLRFQCASRGVPIAGDRIYGNFAFNKAFHNITKNGKLQLLSAKISFTSVINGQHFFFQATTPEAETFLSRYENLQTLGN